MTLKFIGISANSNWEFLKLNTHTFTFVYIDTNSWFKINRLVLKDNTSL